MKIVKIIPDNIDIDYHGKLSKPGCIAGIMLTLAFWAMVLIFLIN